MRAKGKDKGVTREVQDKGRKSGGNHWEETWEKIREGTRDKILGTREGKGGPSGREEPKTGIPK